MGTVVDLVRVVTLAGTVEVAKMATDVTAPSCSPSLSRSFCGVLVRTVEEVSSTTGVLEEPFGCVLFLAGSSSASSTEGSREDERAGLEDSSCAGLSVNFLASTGLVVIKLESSVVL